MATGTRHKWDYGQADAQTSRRRQCAVCYAVGSRFGGRSTPWDITMPDGTYSSRSIPPCPGTRWYRIEDEHPRWVLADGKGGYSHLCTDALIRTYGRKHLETKILKDLPPLPGSAWAVLDGTYWAEVGDVRGIRLIQPSLLS